MDDIEKIVKDLTAQIDVLERYLKYAKRKEVRESLEKDIENLMTKRDIWSTFLS